uniref:Uncharacterized protein n=1 Tax=Anguilla anguilla TaxID=7936 RepID=A0A0E9UM57_ANGAN
MELDHDLITISWAPSAIQSRASR